jgi:hypothetical protein
MSIEKVLEKILKGTSDQNIKFQDLRNNDGNAKQYQVRQVINLFLK